ncbi:hypothetical protein BSKO_01018 [Bryopsis sp. KO-2023]|nr:hypothetical protein BSKO_01018 [Bryopsis sp. KO-2023]
MVKTKGGRLMNPTDAFRKEQRKKEIQRNKLERKYQREAHRRINDPVELKQELQRVLEAEKEGMLNKTLRLKKKVLQEAYDQALKRKKEEELRKKRSDYTEVQPAGPSESNPEDSRYYHPTLNPTGAPPPGKVNAFQCPVPSTAPAVRPPSKASLPIPAPPPLPPGPAPMGMGALPPPPAAPPLPPGPAPQMPQGGRLPLPPPLTPPPGYDEPGRRFFGDVEVLPPPPGPPPSDEDSDVEEDAPPGVNPHHVIPPPSGPPPSTSFPMHLPPGPRPGHPQGMGRLPPPLMPPPSFHPRGQGAGPSSAVPLPPVPQPPPMHGGMAGKRETKTTITGASTVIKRPLAQNDRALTSMVPASVRVRRESSKPKPKPSIRKPDIAPAYGLVPAVSVGTAPPPPRKRPARSGATGPSMEQKIMDFMEEVKGLGAFEDA